MNSKLLEHITRIHAGREEAAILVLVVLAGPGSPQGPGARMLVSQKGRLYGTVGGGQLEKLAEEHAISMLNECIPTDFKTYDLEVSQARRQTNGMICGGRISLYFEHLSPPDRIIIYGCGHIGRVLAPLAVQCGFDVSGIDERCDMTASERFGDTANKNITLLCMQPEVHARSLALRPTDSIVIITHAHRFDLEILKALSTRVSSTSMPRYIGMIGSRKKNRTIMEKLRDTGAPHSFLNAIHAPIGLSTGGDSPAEIAVSIMAEILAVKYGELKDGRVDTMSKSQLNEFV